MRILLIVLLLAACGTESSKDKAVESEPVEFVTGTYYAMTPSHSMVCGSGVEASTQSVPPAGENVEVIFEAPNMITIEVGTNAFKGVTEENGAFHASIDTFVVDPTIGSVRVMKSIEGVFTNEAWSGTVFSTLIPVDYPTTCKSEAIFSGKRL